MKEKAIPQYIIDCQTMKATELRKRYRAEATSHRNMLQRGKDRGNIISPAFRRFGGFLAVVGPKPTRTSTLDRIDNNDPEYAPGKVRWADKRTQNSNKGDSLIFYYSRTGETYTVPRLAALRKRKPSTIRQQKARGWTDDEIIEGKRGDAVTQKPTVPAERRIASAGSGYIPDPSNSRARLVVEKDPKRRRYLQNAEDARYSREVEGVEYCLSSLEEINELFAPTVVTPEQHYRHFKRWWPEWKPHLIVENLEPWAQEYAARIEMEDKQSRNEAAPGVQNDTPKKETPAQAALREHL